MGRFQAVEGEGRARPRWAALAIGLSAAAVLGGALVAGPQEPDSEDPAIMLTRAAMEEYVQVRDLIGKETAQLATDKEFLADQIDLVTRQIESTRAEVEKVGASIEEMATKQTELEAQNTALEQATSSLVSVIAGLEERTKELLLRLPDPIRESEVVRSLSANIPEDPADTKLGLSRRFINVIGILNAVDKFNTDVHEVSELRTLPDGSSARVTVLYLGISQAYYVNGDGTVAGRGVPGEAGFEWMPLDEAASAVQQAVAIKNGKSAVFVQLPITID